MDRFPIARVLVMWLLFLPVPIVNGFFREKWYRPLLGDPMAHQIGSLIVMFVFLAYTYLFFRNILRAASVARAFFIGSIWLVLTVGFEFGMGLAGGRSWGYMLADYDLSAGRVWALVLLVVLFAPLIIRAYVRR